MTVLFSDSFDAPDGTPLDGKPLDVGGVSWEAGPQWTVEGGAARMYSPAPAFYAATFDAGLTDLAVTAVCRVLKPRGGPALRYLDARNFWLATVANGQLNLIERKDNVSYLRASAPVTVTPPYEVTLAAAGQTLTASAGGAAVTFTSGSNEAVTRAGLAVVGGREPQFDEFRAEA